MNIRAALSSDKMCRAITGLTVPEFANLLADFSVYYQAYEANRKPDRKNKVGNGRSSYLESKEEKLLYILWYLKTRPTIDVAAFYIGFYRSRAAIWILTLLPIMGQTLKQSLVRPRWRFSSAAALERLYPEVREVFADGIARSIRLGRSYRWARGARKGDPDYRQNRTPVVGYSSFPSKEPNV